MVAVADGVVQKKARAARVTMHASCNRAAEGGAQSMPAVAVELS